MTATYVITNKHSGHSAASPREFLVRVRVSEEPAIADAETQELRDVAWADFGRCLASRQLAALARSSMACALCLFALFSLGCSDRTRINNGADLAIYVGTPQHMFDHIPAGVYKGNARLDGYYSPADGSITISEQLHGWSLVRTFVHEFGHAADHQRPSDIWELMARYQAPGFDFNFHPDQCDIERARDAARAATEANP
jgi:hypothetical protein